MPKIKSIKVLDDGLSERQANELWDKIETNAGYQFNKSHSVEYAIISYQAMWLKVYYPPEFFAASMSILAEDKLFGLLSDAARHGIEIYPPDINLSTDKFEIDATGKKLIAPFNRCKGLSDNTALAIVEARSGDKFVNKEDFINRVAKRKCNARAQEVLDRVGAFALIEPGQLPPRHPDRIKDQIELMPGLVGEFIKADRAIIKDKYILHKLNDMIGEVNACGACSLVGGVHPLPAFGKTPKFMVVTDCPNFSEDREGRMMKGEGGDYVKRAILDAGMTLQDGYFTSLVKSMKNGKFLTNEQINGCTKYLQQEIELLKPPVIVVLGNAAVKYFVPGEKAKPQDLMGRVFYSKELDANIVIGLNPALCHFTPERVEDLVNVFKLVTEMVY